jgi:serine/threonine protein kinase
MTPERFRQIRNLFDAALERDAASRPSFLAEACRGDDPLRAEIERLLAAHQQEAPLLDRPAVRPELLTADSGRMEGRRIDHYEILRELGRGGMGSVYLAVRTDDVYRKPVALKVVRPECGTPETIARFRQEREILASLDHPNIARLLDGGTTPEGLPYFVMDFVEGRPIDVYCDEHELNITDRMRLFRSVCAAVEYAHRRRLVHRDLKLGNILVTADGVPKLLDFGIAKLLRAEDGETAAYVTRTGMRLMTPEYASPEQVRGERVGPASDIYSLGVILYEMLTGHRPYRMRSRLIHEVARVICEEEPTRPSTAVTESEQRLTAGEEKPVMVTPQSVSRSRSDTPAGLRRQLAGDPDKILLKALRKAPAERYASAAALDEDMRRHLDGLPVLAQGERSIYRAGKYLQRYRGWAIAVAVLLAGFATGVAKLTTPGIAILLAFAMFAAGAYYPIRWVYGSQVAFRAAIRIAVIEVVCLAAAMLLMPFSERYWYPVVILTPVVVAGVAASAAMLRWPFRARWAGALLADLTLSKDRKLWVACASVVTTLAALNVWFGIHVNGISRMLQFSWGMLAGYLALVSLIALGFSAAGRVEFRQRGALISGVWIPWSSIESYAWKEADGAFATLKLRSRRWLLAPLGPMLSVVLPSAQKISTDRILKSVLAEWPGS